MTFTGFGAPVHLTPPPARQTADINSAQPDRDIDADRVLFARARL
jgi:hypothetical protein